MDIINVLRSHGIGVGKKLKGDAQPGDVLLNKTFSNADGNDKVGTMPNNGSVGTQNLTTEGAEYTIPAGYHNGLGKVKAVIANLIASVIKAGVTVGGIVGTFTSDATAVAANILSGVTAYVNGSKITGTMANNGAVTITPSISNQTIPVGYHNGSGYVAGDTDLVAANIKSGVNIFGVTGTGPSKRTASGYGNLGSGPITVGFRARYIMWLLPVYNLFGVYDADANVNYCYKAASSGATGTWVQSTQIYHDDTMQNEYITATSFRVSPGTGAEVYWFASE